MLPFSRVAILGCGLIGSSVARAVRTHMPTVGLTGSDIDPEVRVCAQALDLFDDVTDSASAAVVDADLVIFATPVGAMAGLAAEIAADLPAGVVVSDVGSVKANVLAALTEALPGISVIPAHPVAGTEKSGPEAGFASLFHNRWCILTPPENAITADIERLRSFWTRLGANVEIMEARHHDMVLAVTSHLPHLIAYSIVGTASDLEGVTNSEVIKFSAGGFRDFTRIAASDPVMWRDVFLTNRDAVLEVLQRFNEDLTALQRAIRWGDGEALYDLFSRSRSVRRAIIDAGQDTAVPDFGREHG